VRAAALAFLVAAVAKLCGTSITLSSGWRGGFIIPLFFMGVALGRLGHAIFPGTDLVVLMSAFMAANNVGVTKTALGTTLIVTEMTGIHLLPTTLLASVIALLLTSQVSLIHTQQERESAYETWNTPDATGGAMP
jgi:H+/Cl- antiporter ClcA